jgi:hypothetical protein
VIAGRGPERKGASEVVGVAVVESVVALTVTTRASANKMMPKIECMVANQ